MTEHEAINRIKYRISTASESVGIGENCNAFEDLEMAIKALEEIQQYRVIGSVEELLKAVKEEDILKFYYCESEDSYLVGIRIDNFYYAHWDGKRFVFDMSRYLPWGEHVVDDTTAWKEYTYPSEPKEMDFSSWLQGFIKKECGGTIDECREAAEKQKAIKPIKRKDGTHDCICGNGVIQCECYCSDCGQKLDWSDK